MFSYNLGCLMLTEVLLFCLTNMSLVFYYDLEIVFIFDKIILPI
jgi:hypothetical protein